MAVTIHGITRRGLMLGGLAGACCAPWSGALAAGTIYTPHEIAEEFARRVPQRMHLPDVEEKLYAGMAEIHLVSNQRVLRGPQYLLVIDANPEVQAALLMWRLSAGHYDLLGAAPVSTGGPSRRDGFETPQGVYEPRHDHRQPGVYDLGLQRARNSSGRGAMRSMRLQVRPADRRAQPALGTPASDGNIVLPAELLRFLDEFGLLDGDLPQQRSAHAVPFRGRHLLVLDSERDRPEWAFNAAPVAVR